MGEGVRKKVSENIVLGYPTNHYIYLGILKNSPMLILKLGSMRAAV